MKNNKWLIVWLLSIGFVFIFGLWANDDGSRSRDTDQEIAALQKAIAAEGLSWEAGETSMTLLSKEERLQRLGARPGPIPEVDQDIDREMVKPAVLPAVFDWRNHNGNWVTSVKNQGNCGSCWAFATAGVLESLVKIVKNVKTDLDLSEQMLVSCSGAGNCSGGYQDRAAEYVRITGIPRESCFPYSASEERCRPCPDWASQAVKITSWRMYYNQSKTVLETALQQAPINAYMEVYSDFYHYRSGIYERSASATYDGGHAIVIVGYNDTQRYWICKNSWGTGWGENGFFRIRMGNSDICKWCVGMSGPRLDNHAPALQAIPAQNVNEGQGLVFTLVGTDADNDTLTYSGNNLPEGAVVDAVTGDFSWTPTFTQAGVYNIQFTVTDGLDEVRKTAAITVVNVKYKKW